ncbi:multidrug efflux pump VmrA [uncultured Ruminococcus sp.]|nr:multidrug efflux pump VmrA [uncultured Ruminococcus sp.]
MAGRKEMDLTTGRPFGSLLKFAIPVILGNLFQLFYTLADSVIVGKTLGADSLAAVGSTSIIIYFVLCFINGFTGGFGICLGQRCGARDERGMRKSIAVSTILSIAFAVVLNIFLDILFILSLGMGVAGAAWATILSQFLSAVLSLMVGMRRFEVLHLRKADFANLGNAMVVHLKTGFPMGFQMSVMCIGQLAMQMVVNSLGTAAVYRTTIQSMQNGWAPFAACMIELVMRISATVGLVGMLGYTSVCIASPMAWFGACALLIPCYYRMMKVWKKDK